MSSCELVKSEGLMLKELLSPCFVVIVVVAAVVLIPIALRPREITHSATKFEGFNSEVLP